MNDDCSIRFNNRAKVTINVIDKYKPADEDACIFRINRISPDT